MPNTSQTVSDLRMHFDLASGLEPELQLMAIIEEATRRLLPGTTPQDVTTRARVAHWYHQRHNEYSSPTQ